MDAVQLKQIIVEYLAAKDANDKINAEHWRYPHQTLYDAWDRFKAAEGALRKAGE